MAIVLDTNFILSVFELKVDLFSALEETYGKSNILIPSIVIGELEKLKKKTALLALTKKNYSVVPVEMRGSVDNSILEFCKANNYVLASQDAELKRKAKQQHLKILAVRQKKYLYEA